MQIEMEMDSGYGDLEVLRRFRLDGRDVKVSHNLDQWTWRACREKRFPAAEPRPREPYVHT